MSGEPQNLAAPGDEPLWAGWYAGPARGDDDRRRLQLCRGEAVLSLSVEELTRLITWRPDPAE